MSHLNTVWMPKYLQNLQLSIFIPLILVDFFDGNVLYDGVTLRIKAIDHGLVDHSKTAIADDLLCLVELWNYFGTFLDFAVAKSMYSY